MLNYNYFYADIPAQPFPQNPPFPEGTVPEAAPFPQEPEAVQAVPVQQIPVQSVPVQPVPPQSVPAGHDPEQPLAPADLPPAPAPSLDEELARLLDTLEQPPLVSSPPADRQYQPQHRHRKRSVLGSAVARGAERVAGLSLRRGFSIVVAGLTAVIVVVMGALGGLVSYAPLRALAGDVDPQGLEDLWPLLVYGPWLAGALSVLRASLNRQRAVHAWCVVILFSAVAVMLCTVHAPLTLPGLSVAALPPVTVLLSFHQLVRQIDLPAADTPAAARNAHARRGSHRQPVQ